MSNPQRLRNAVFINALLLGGVAYPHLIDDFLFDIPEEFGLTDIQTQILAGIFTLLFVGAIGLAARADRRGYVGTAFWGGFLALAGILKHIPLMVQPGPYWSGMFSEALIVLMILSGIPLMLLSIFAFRISRQVDEKPEASI